MKHPLTKPLLTLLALMSTFAVAACGVRGRPMPPDTPPQIGRGQPSFNRASEEFAFPNVPNPNATPASRQQTEPRSETPGR